MDTLLRALDQRAAIGEPVRFWIRDDDAVAPSQPLDRLLRITAEHHIPLTLAVIPKFAGRPLVDRLRPVQQVAVAVHGWAHTNHARPGEKKQELGPHRPSAVVLDELRTGFDQLQDQFPKQFIPVLVPPWNRIATEFVEALPSLGFRALSTFGAETAVVIPMLNTHVDLIDWRGARGGRADAALFVDLAAAVVRGGPVGLLTHHLDHDAQAWEFMERLFALTVNHPGCRWTSLPELLASPRLPSDQ